MNPLAVNHIFGFSLISIVLPIIAWLVFFNRSKHELNRSFTAYILSITWWAFFTIFMILAPSHEWGLFWDRMCLSGTVFIPSTLFHFVTVFSHNQSRLKKVILANYFISFIFLIILWATRFFVYDVAPKFGMNYFTIPGPAYIFFIFFFLECVIISVTQLWTYQKRASTPILKKQALYLFWFSVIGYLGGSCNYLLVYDINLPGVAETSNYGVLILSVSIAYIIFRYQFLDIQLIIRRTVIFAGLTSFVFGVFAFVTFVVQDILGAYLPVGRMTTTFVSVLLIVLGYDPLRQLLIHITDRFLFQRKFDYQKLLRDASQGMSKIKSLDHLCRLVTHFITMRVRVKNAGVLSREIGTDNFYFNYGRGYQSPPLLKIINTKDPLIRYLLEEQEPIDIDRATELMEGRDDEGPRPHKPRSKHDYETIRNRMLILKAAACIPSFLGSELRNILILGEKKSGEHFTDDDLNVLYTLAQESAIAIENARLYDEAIFKSKELQTINNELEVAQSNLIKALNETELANKRLQDTQAQLIHEQKMATLGRLASSVGHEVNNPLTILSMNVSRAILKYRKNQHLKVAEILDIFQKMEQNIGRIKAVVNTLTGLLKKSEKGKFEPLSLKLVLEETLPLVQFQTYLDNLSGTEVEFDIPGNTPLIRGDLERLQEVFLNLFINAYHAMQGRRERQIFVKAYLKPDNGKMVLVEFTDNGCGMAEDVAKKIFNYGFTTKPVGKGSGLGLYMCRYIIELHGGDINVRSKPGEGTTFSISLPIYEEESSIGIEEQLGTKGK
ncbi:MAG: hypothetical protein COV74_06120 [Candidatus Omnitrophica bacterium CG11_big_fil_rev_8_21_14_0_20_45_26]|uniref:histidine kinase n=1 Tax=Candidatus Abzuiibacterium crystallinum TaxID=1974748 RepID=A0A2H0LNR2_9BACT|nr:MAG: hypothetical protein COV74_06120 [Candidatus Omnitrophica bacterium CG11_big_fil_rev_8_21_14_0_20_45_26]PIW63200.1 MAG: hypothetical protein COW12_11310 [Candidatus Omnitrophica bacterium CG12_big_fil_rev_8_21_14_0_65_45_16]